MSTSCRARATRRRCAGPRRGAPALHPGGQPREGWTGHLWQGRFASCALDPPHLLAAARYIERNPVRADSAGRSRRRGHGAAPGALSGQDDGLVRRRAAGGDRGRLARVSCRRPDRSAQRTTSAGTSAPAGRSATRASSMSSRHASAADCAPASGGRPGEPSNWLIEYCIPETPQASGHQEAIQVTCSRQLQIFENSMGDCTVFQIFSLGVGICEGGSVARSCSHNSS